MQAINGDDIVNFITEQFFDYRVTNEEEAEACVKDMIDRIGVSAFDTGWLKVRTQRALLVFKCFMVPAPGEPCVRPAVLGCDRAR